MTARAEASEMPRDYMCRCAQAGVRGIFEYREELVADMPGLRFIGAVFRDERSARQWDDRPGKLVEWSAFLSWESAETWLYDAAREG